MCRHSIYLFLLLVSDKQQISILKVNGERVSFDENKLIRALVNAGATSSQARDIAFKVEQKLYDGIPSGKIYQTAYALLRKTSHRSAGRYRLKKAIQDLGPSGYPFEIFVGRLFESFGYQVEIGKQLQGKCIHHEVDVVAKKPKEKVIVECKFHSDNRAKTNVQVPLYIHSRFNDIEAKWKEANTEGNIKFRGYVVTNTRFTMDAINFSECAGLSLISWDYPENGSLKSFIDQSGLHPITSLHTLNKSQKKQMLDEGIVLCRELISHTHLMKKYSFTEQQMDKVLKEVNMLVH